MKKFLKKLLLGCTLLAGALSYGQTGAVTSFSAADSFENDSVNLVTLTPSINIPLLTKSEGALPGSVAVVSPQACVVTHQGNPNVINCGRAGNGYTLLAQFYTPVNPLIDMKTDATTTFVQNCSTNTMSNLIEANGLASHSIPWTQVVNPSSCNGAHTKTVTTTDGSGITVTIVGGVNNPSITSLINASGWTSDNGTVTDPFGNTVSNPAGTSFTDSLGAITTFGTSNSTIGYTDTTGTAQTISFVNGTQTTFQPLCNGSSGAAVTPVSSLSFPDGTSVGFTWDTHNGGIDGLIKSFTTRAGGTVSYTYGTVFSCTSAVPWAYNTLSRTTIDGTTSYSMTNSGGLVTTTVLDPGQNKTVYVFVGSFSIGPSYRQSVTRYQNTGTVGSPVYTLASSTSYCYNNVCGGTTAPTLPITTYEIKQYVGSGSTFMSDETQTFDSTYGLLLTDTTTDEITSQTIKNTIVYGTNNNGTCVALGNTNIHDHICDVSTWNGTTELAEVAYSYNSNGAPTSRLDWTGSSWLTTTYSPNSNGTNASTTLPNNQTINYTYGNCNSLLPTDATTTVNGVAIDNKETWNCNGSVVVDTTDPNGNEDDATYDSMFRVLTRNDRLENTTTFAYGTPTLDHIKVTDPLNIVAYQYADGLGRPTVSQICQTSACSTLDTSSVSYAWNGVNFEAKSYVPCAKTILNSPCPTVAKTVDSNPILGPVSSTDANGGILTFARNSKDLSVTAGPAPSGENTKIAQTEMDGFGRLTSACGLLSSGGTACGQTMGNSGILTSNTYSFGTGSSTTTTTRGSQTHTTVSDALDRVTSTTTPEAGTVTNYYDSISGTTCASTPAAVPGALIATKDNAGQYICFWYDGLNRVTDVGNTYQNSSQPCKRFRYDATSNVGWAPPSGYPSSGNNLLGRLVETATDGCNANTLQTDEWFAYDKDGRMTDMWQLDPNSGGAYRHTTVGYDADGTITSLSGLPGISTLTYVTDGEDRWNTATLGSTTVLSGVGYDAASRPTLVDVGASTSGYWDTFSYDNVGNMTQYTFNVNSNNNTGNLTWSSNGSLRQLAVTDTLNSSNAQTCTFGTSSVMGYDDVGRLLSDNCGSVWAQTYSYDQYDNLTKSGSLSWNPGYNSSNNEYQNGATYDSNGNLKTDGASNTYTWNVYNKMASENGTSVAYDAFGRMVTFGNREYLYTPMGLVGNFTSGVSNGTMLPMPGRGALDVDSSGGLHFYHQDWLGSNRTATGVSVTGHVDWDKSYSPYGDAYNSTSTDVQFAGMNDDTSTGITYSTPNRELATNASRWLSPDPAHASWNAYSYVTDPNWQTDPSGSDPQSGSENNNSGEGPCTAYGTGSGSKCKEGRIVIPRTTDGTGAPLYGESTGKGSTVDPTMTAPNSHWSEQSTNGLSAASFQHSHGGAGAGGCWGDWCGWDWVSTLSNKFGWSREEILETYLNLTTLPLGEFGASAEWKAPTFTVESPDAKTLRAIREFVQENPQLARAKCGSCGIASGNFQRFARARGINVDYVRLNDINGPGDPLLFEATNPTLHYTRMYDIRGLFHVVNLTKDGWLIDMSAMQFVDHNPTEVSYPLVRKLKGH